MAKREFIDKTHLLAEIKKLQKSPWYNRGENDMVAVVRALYNERKEAVEVVRDLCVNDEPTITEQEIVKPILDKIRADYENRLKADMVAMLTEIQLDIEELNTPPAYQDEDYFLIGTNRCSELIQQKIDEYKAKGEEYVNFADDLIPIMDEAESEE